MWGFLFFMKFLPKFLFRIIKVIEAKKIILIAIGGKIPAKIGKD
jgi:hypothetical protein